MKKRNILKITIIIISSLVCVLSFIYALIMFILPEKKIEVVDTVTFLEVVNKYDCRVESIVDSDNYKSNNYYVTVDSSCPVTLSYRVFSEDKEGEKYYSDILKSINKVDAGISTNADINIFGYNYHFNSISSKNYQAVVMNDNTVLYVSSDVSDKDIAVNILKDLGYYYEVNLSSLWLFIIPGVSLIIFIVTMIWLIVPSIKKKEF